MLNEHTLAQLRTLRLDGMVHALEDQASTTAAAELLRISANVTGDFGNVTDPRLGAGLRG